MSITDKELLTFCNLANLEMEYANIIRGYKDGGKDLEGNQINIPINHTIYSLLSQGRNEDNIGDLDLDFDSIDENKDRAYIENLPKIFRSKIEERKRRIKQRYGEEAAKKVGIELKEIDDYKKEGINIIESAPIVFDYLDNPNLNEFLKQWEIVYAENLNGIIIDFMYYAYRDIAETILSREEFFLKYKFFEIEEDIEEKKEIEIDFNETTKSNLEDFINKCEYTLLKGILMFIDENMHHIVKADESSLDPIMTTLSAVGTLNSGNDLKSGTFSKVKLFFNDLELKGYKSLKNLLKIKNIKIRDIMLETLKRIDSLKIKSINCEKLSKTLEGILKKCFSQKSLNTLGNIGNIATYLSMVITGFREFYSLVDKIENMYVAPKISFDRIKIRKSDFKVIILKKDKEYVIVFNNFKDSELKKCLDTGSMNRDFTYIMLSIIRKLLEDPNIKNDKDKAIISDQMEATKKGLELIEMKLDVPITFTGFGNGGALAAYFSGIFKKNFKSFENNIECQSSLINICNYNERDLDMIDEKLKTSEVLFSDITIVIYQALWESTFSKVCTALMTFWCAASIISALVAGATSVGIITIFISTLALYTFLGTVVVIVFLIADYIVERIILKNEIKDLKKKNYLIEKNGILLVSDNFFKTNPNRLFGISLNNRKLEFILEYLLKKEIYIKNTISVLSYKDYETKVRYEYKYKIITKNNQIDYSKSHIVLYKTIPDKYSSDYDVTKILEYYSEIKDEKDLYTYLIKNNKTAIKAISIYNSLEFQYKIQNNLVNRENFNLKNNNKLFYVSPVNELIVFNNLNPIIENFNKVKNFDIYEKAYNEFWNKPDSQNIIYLLSEKHVLHSYQIIETEDKETRRSVYNHQFVNLKDRKKFEKLSQKLDKLQQIKGYSSEQDKAIDNIDNELKSLILANKLINLRVFQDEYRYFPFMVGDNLTKNLNSNYTISGLALKIEETHKDIDRKAREARKKYVKEKIDQAKEYANEKIEYAREKINQAIDVANEQVENFGEVMSEAGKDMAEDIREKVEKGQY